jgi:RAT1-interacting protein
LTIGYHDFIKHDDSKDEHLDGLLKALIHSEQQTNTRVQADIVTWRGMMTKLMTAPYERFDGFDMHATMYQGTIYIEEDHSAKLNRNARSTSGPGPGGIPNDMFAYMGYKFESLCLIPDTWDATSREFIEGREGHVVSNKAQYCSIVRTGIGSVSMVMGGEVDAGTH